jgi:histidyl-tRNA synthetase
MSSDETPNGILPPKGVRVRTPLMVLQMSTMFDKLKSIMKLYGIEERDYSVFERYEHLMKKYGDDEKLIYELQHRERDCGPQDQNGQQLALRYDLTTQHLLYENRSASKTFQIGKVYRRENNSNEQQRFREFYQFDIDYKGQDKLIALVEIFQLLNQCLQALLQSDQFTILINCRKLIDDILDQCSVKFIQRATVCSTLDKLDKIGWDAIMAELITKGIETNVVQQIKQAVQGTIIPPLIIELQRLLFGRVNLCFSATLIRGLSYYTDIIFEVKYKDITIAGGGEYGNNFVGFSLGLDRILSFLISNECPVSDTTNVILAVGNKGRELALNIAAEERAHLRPVHIEYIDNHKQIRKAFGKIKLKSDNVKCAILAENEIQNYEKDGVIYWK